MPEQPTDFDPLVDQAPSRYVVGIDLGTTNSAVCYIDTQESPWQVRVFSVPQFVAPRQIESRSTLPSFHFQMPPGDAADECRMPWDQQSPQHVVGFLARDEGTASPGRLIASAKSWLCHTGVNRTADLLPWHGADDVERLSPVEVSSRYLRHISGAWNAAFPQDPLSDQDLVITLPASFDEVARELTVDAAARAELPRVVLIEEPQAAFYAWVNKHAESWHEQVEPGQTILVCDIGGGTTDFTLIRVRQSDVDDGQPEGRVQFHRVAVGDHLILGGDNLDLALAKHVEQRLTKGGKLEPRQWDVLTRSCRRVKETLLGEDPPDKMTLNLPGSGSKLIGGSLQAEVTREEVTKLLVEGFLPAVDADARPTLRQSGFQEFGLPFATDPAMTKYLAAFLAAHADDDGNTRPNIVLFNGGFFASPVLRARLLEVVASWFSRDADWSPAVLDNDRLDLAVARGAAYYGMVRRGEGVRIAASLARSYYIGVESDPPVAVCLVPGNAEPGQDVALIDRTFSVRISEPVEFPLFVSSTRLTDRPGEPVPFDREQMKPLPPIRTVLKTQRRSESGTVPVRLHAKLTEIGTIDLWCSQVDHDRSWRIQFDIRAATQTDVDVHHGDAETAGFVDESVWEACRDLLVDVFGAGGPAKPDGLVKRLAKVIGTDRTSWPSSLLRRIWETLMELEAGRRKSVVHEVRWLNLVGFSLRPGFGMAVDDWRVAETWRTVQGKLAHAAPQCRSELSILWRRIGGGLSAGQQVAVAERLITSVRGLHARYVQGKSRGSDITVRPQDTNELWRLLGSLELLTVTRKVELGDLIVDLLPKRKLESARNAMIWALGRLGQRVPVYGPLNTVVPRDAAIRWLDSVFQHGDGDTAGQIAAMQLARFTDDRYRDLPADLRKEAVDWLETNNANPHLIVLVRDGGQLDQDEQKQVFGEALPKGLRIQ